MQVTAKNVAIVLQKLHESEIKTALESHPVYGWAWRVASPYVQGWPTGLHTTKQGQAAEFVPAVNAMAAAAAEVFPESDFAEWAKQNA